MTASLGYLPNSREFGFIGAEGGDDAAHVLVAGE
jgi:hypothetical protein